MEYMTSGYIKRKMVEYAAKFPLNEIEVAVIGSFVTWLLYEKNKAKKDRTTR